MSKCKCVCPSYDNRPELAPRMVAPRDEDCCGGRRIYGTCPDCAAERADCCAECGCCVDCGPCAAHARPPLAGRRRRR